MKTEIEDAIKAIAVTLSTVKTPDDAMKLSQAALNLAHVLATINNIRTK